MDGYYEWRVNSDDAAGKKTRKTPFFMYREDGEPLFMAGLWSVWKPAKDASPLLSCTIITTDARGRAGARSTTGCRWWYPSATGTGGWTRTPRSTTDLLAPHARCARHRMREVSTLVNNVRNNGPQLLEPAEPEPEQATLL